MELGEHRSAHADTTNGSSDARGVRRCQVNVGQMAMLDRHPPARDGLDLLLVCGVVLLVLGVAVVIPGVIPPHSAAPLVPEEHSELVHAKGLMTQSVSRPRRGMRHSAGITNTSTMFTRASGRAPSEEAYRASNNSDRDLRLVLTGMANQQRRITPQHLAGVSILSDAPSLALAEAAANKRLLRRDPNRLVD